MEIELIKAVKDLIERSELEPVELKFVQLHGPIFVGGTNLSDRLDPNRRVGLKIYLYKRYICVFWNEDLGLFDAVNAGVMLAGKPKRAADVISHPMVANISSAQVETPFGHVHAGPGKGKTGK